MHRQQSRWNQIWQRINLQSISSLHTGIKAHFILAKCTETTSRVIVVATNTIHSLAVAEKVEMLETHMTYIQGKKPPLKLSALAEDGIDLEAAGGKGGRKRKKYRPNTERVTLPTTQPVYNSVHHNDNAFVVRFLPVPVKCLQDLQHRFLPTSTNPTFQYCSGACRKVGISCERKLSRE